MITNNSILKEVNNKIIIGRGAGKKITSKGKKNRKKVVNFSFHRYSFGIFS